MNNNVGAINYFFFVAEEVRQIMAELGFRKLDEMVGRLDCLDQRTAVEHFKAKGLDFSKLLYKPDMGDVPIHNCDRQDHKLDNVLDRWLINEAGAALSKGTPVKIKGTIKNTDRTAGAMLSGEVAKRYGHKGLPEKSIQIKLKGTAGQSFGAFLTQPFSIYCEGACNDYVGKSLSGGELVIYPTKQTKLGHIIVGNTCFYGATSGYAFIAGAAGERFAVRNSGATLVIEGVGDHACEYMTAGTVICLGTIGINFGAGMSGGEAYLYGSKIQIKERLNNLAVSIHTLNRNDLSFVKQHLAKHLQKTKSIKAKMLLDNWSIKKKKLVKIIPKT